jgi:hypothetical protein
VVGVTGNPVGKVVAVAGGCRRVVDGPGAVEVVSGEVVVELTAGDPDANVVVVESRAPKGDRVATLVSLPEPLVKAAAPAKANVIAAMHASTNANGRLRSRQKRSPTWEFSAVSSDYRRISCPRLA